MKHFATSPDSVPQFHWRGAGYSILLDAAATRGALSVVMDFTPPHSGPPRHVHDDADETFVVLDGELEFWLEGERFRCTAGQTAFVPRGAEHTFTNPTEREARALVVLTPGGFEGFFLEMAEQGLRIPEDLPRIAEAAGRFACRFTGPPLGIDVASGEPLRDGRA